MNRGCTVSHSPACAALFMEGLPLHEHFWTARNKCYLCALQLIMPRCLAFVSRLDSQGIKMKLRKKREQEEGRLNYANVLKVSKMVLEERALFVATETERYASKQNERSGAA